MSPVSEANVPVLITAPWEIIIIDIKGLINANVKIFPPWVTDNYKLSSTVYLHDAPEHKLWPLLPRMWLWAGLYAKWVSN